jgi:hypothetical protein
VVPSTAGCCACDCACEPPGAEALLLDSNVLAGLARLATVLAGDGAARTAEAAFRELLDALTCCRQRPLLLARTQLEDEIEAGARAPYLYADLGDGIFRELFQLCHAAPPAYWEPEHDGDTDRAIAASAVDYGGPVTIVTVDAKFRLWIDRAVGRGDLGGDVTAMDGIELIGRLTACHALSEETFAAAVERELAYLDERVQSGYSSEAASRRRAEWRQVEIEVATRLERADREGGSLWGL